MARMLNQPRSRVRNGCLDTSKRPWVSNEYGVATSPLLDGSLEG